jgi:uncharacterized membrane protein YphA (DoxX/SURF4 family)
MVITERIENWTDTHHPAWLDLVRMGLGIFLVVKGFLFIKDIAALQQLLENVNIDWSSYWLAHLIAFTHIIGGFLITIGLLTRPAILFQIPILVGAVFFIWAGAHDSTVNPMVPGGVLFVWSSLDNSPMTSEWFISIIVLILLIVFWIFDSGPWSVDRYLQRYEEE